MMVEAEWVGFANGLDGKVPGKRTATRMDDP